MNATALNVADWVRWLVEHNLPSIVVAVAIAGVVILELARPPE